MVLMGVPPEKIRVEGESKNTHESARNVKEIMSQSGRQEETFILVTSGFHMRRSLACFAREGLHVNSFSADFFSHPRYFYFNNLLIPDLEALMIWHKLFKEWVGMIAYKIVGYI